MSNVSAETPAGAPAPDPRDPATWPPEALASLQRILDESLRAAGTAVSAHTAALMIARTDAARMCPVS